MKRIVFLLSISMPFVVSCRDTINLPHIGSIKGENSCYAQVDTMYVVLERSSCIGNYYMIDSTITFVDAITCSFWDINLKGQIVSNYFHKGNGKNELPSLLYAYPIENHPNNRVLIIDSNNGVSFFDPNLREINKRGIADFGWNNNLQKSYANPFLYNFSFFTDFGVSFSYTPDSKILFHTNVVNRKTKNPTSVEKKRYEDAAIFGKLNPENMKVEKVFGCFPQIYKNKPMPHLEFFQYTIVDDKILVNHTVDSLIYVYQYPDKPLYTIGYECKEIDRNYSSSADIDNSAYFEKDLTHVGFNTGLKFFSELNMLCRTYIKSASTGNSGMQIYIDNNLIADIDVPDFFNLLGYHEGYFYGTSYIPIEDDSSSRICLYRLKISNIINS